MTNLQLLALLDQLLNAKAIRDYCPNGLQVEGKADIRHIVTGVTATQALIDRAIEQKADAILVHHGYFWKGEREAIRGMKKQRIKALLDHDINLFAYHLPLDMHPSLGNNAQLGKLLGLTTEGGLELGNPQSVAVKGFVDAPITAEDMAKRIESALGRVPLLEKGGEHLIKTVAWCTGGGQSYIEMAAEQRIDAFITGEVSEHTIHTAREMGIHFFAAGHHATERYGAKALGEYLAAEHGFSVSFVDIDNPA